MCTIYLNTKSHNRTGYKVVAIKDDKLYSSFTGEEFKVGVVPRAPKVVTRLANYWNSRLDEKPLNMCGFYDPTFNGHTSAFVDLLDAKQLYTDMVNYNKYSTIVTYDLIIVKVVFKSCVEGTYQGSPVIAGTEVTSIKRVKL